MAETPVQQAAAAKAALLAALAKAVKDGKGK